MKRATTAAQAAGFLDLQTGGVVPPIQTSTTFARDADYAPLNPDNVYSRDHSDNLRQAQRVLCALEGGQDCLLFPSGMAAIAGLFRTLRAGDCVLLQSGIYWGTTKWLRDFAERWAVSLVEVEAHKTDLLLSAIAEHRPKLVFVETPSNPWLRTTDITKTAEAVHSVGGLLAVDSTAATPILSRPLEFGADIVMHSATKALNGHSDVLAGALVTNNADSDTWAEIAEDRQSAGAMLGPFEAWLLLRGLRTLDVRVSRMSENAMAIARHLAAHDAVEEVFYPGLDSHQGHAVAVKQMSGGFGGLLSFLVKGDKARALEVIGKLKLIHRATSLGGTESLAEHRYTIEPHTGIPENLIRLSIGIEAAEDLIADLDEALGLESLS